MTPDARQPGFYPRIQLSKYGLKPKGDYDIFDLSVTAAALMSKYGLKPKGDYDFQVMRHAPRNYLPSKYGLKPKGDYDTTALPRMKSSRAAVQIRTEAERRL